MDEVYEYCVRMLGAGAVAIHAAHEAFVAGGSDRIDRLAGAVYACRSRDMGAGLAVHAVPGGDSGTLADSVAREVAEATAKLAIKHREALALSDLVGLSHGQIARVLETDRDSAATLVARARLALRANRRGVDEEPDDACADRARALVVIVRRQDGARVAESAGELGVGVGGEDEDWLVGHLGSCESCSRVHAAMLEASVCYRAWRIPDPAATRPGASRPSAAGDGNGAGEPQDAVGDSVP